MNNGLMDEYLEYNPNCLEHVRKEFDLSDPEIRKNTINLLQEWIRKQEHFMKKDFDSWYLEKNLLMGKGSVEATKIILDKMCTTKTLLPQFFDEPNTKEDYRCFHDKLYCVLLPKQTDYRRVFLCKCKSTDIFTQKNLDIFVKFNISLAEYAFFYDYPLGSYLVLDILDLDPKDLLIKIGLNNLRNIATVFIEGYQMRIKGVYFISSSKIVDIFVTAVKQVVSPKVADRIWICKSYEDLYNYLPREILPKDYGGDEKSLHELREKLIDRITGEEHMNNVREMNKARTNETYRQIDKFNETYAGMPGTFRQLKVD